MGLKLVFKIVLLLLILFYVGRFFGLKITDADENSPVVKFYDSAGNFKLEIREPEKTKLKEMADKAKSLIYSEATKHNPAGDMLPDGIDNRVIEEVKERIN